MRASRSEAKGAASIHLQGIGCLVGSITMRPQGFIPVARIIGLLILLPTLLLVVLGGYFYHSARAFEQRSVFCEGTVVDLPSSRNDSGATVFTPVFSYKDAAGVVHQGRSNMSSGNPGYVVGGPIPLRYDAQNPSDVRVDTFWAFWFGPIFFAIVATPLLVFALILIFLVPFAIRRLWPEPSAEGIRAAHALNSAGRVIELPPV